MTMIEEAVKLCKDEILVDISDGMVPPYVSSFGDLHEYVDANEYGGLCAQFGPDAHASYDDWIEFCEQVQNTVDAWIKGGF